MAPVTPEILLAEDSPTQAQKLKFILERCGYAVVLAGNGNEALARLADCRPAAVISDIVMPEMDGYELCRRIKQDPARASLPVILVTSLSDSLDVLRGLEAGADNFIVKPYDEQYLLSRLAQILEGPAPGDVRRASESVRIDFAGHTFNIGAGRAQILNLLLSTYETAVSKNLELVRVRDLLRALNEQLEERVRERTAELQAEVVERQRAEAAVRELNQGLERRVLERTAQLEYANKELEAFAYSVSHDLQAPLRAIDGFSKILLQDHLPQLTGDAVRYLELVAKNAAQLRKLIRDLLDFSRYARQPLRKQPVDPAPLVETVLAELGVGGEQSGRTIVVGTLPPCSADPNLLKQVYVNLLSNAIKFSSGRQPAKIEVGSLETEGGTCYFVRDNGVGFDMELSDRLFGVFQRLHRSEEYEGTGVGLAIVQRVILRHGGRVWAESTPGQGASFYFTLGRDA